MLASSLQDMLIYSKDLVRLGRVRDFEVDPSQMKVTHLILELEDQAAKELFGKSPVIRHAKGRVATLLIEGVRDVVVLKQPMKELKGVIESL